MAADEKSNKEYNKSLKDRSKLQKDVTAATKKSSKAAKRYLDIISDTVSEAKDFNKLLNSSKVTVDSLTKSLKNMPKVADSIGDIENDFKKLSNAAEDVGSTLSDLGINFHKDFKVIGNRTAALSKEFAKLINKSAGVAKLAGSLDAIPKVLKKLQKEMTEASNIDTTASLGEMRKKLDDIEGNLPVDDFKKLQSTLNKMSGKNIAELPEIIKEFQETVKKVDLSELGNVTDIDTYRKKIDGLTDSLDKLGMSNDAKNKIDGIKKVMESLIKSNVMGLISDDAKESMGIIQEQLKKPEVNINGLIANFAKLQTEIPKATSIIHDKIAEDGGKIIGEINNLTNNLKGIEKQFSIPKTLQVNTDIALSKIIDFKDEVKRQEFTIGAEGLIPDSVLDNAEELSKIEDDIEKNKKEYLKSIKKMASLSDDDLDTKKSLQKVQQKILKNIKDSITASDALVDSANRRLVLGEEISEKGFGQEKANELANKFVKAEITLQKMGKKGGAFGKVLGKLGTQAGKLGDKLRGLAFPIGMMTSAISMGKMIMNLEVKGAQMFQTVADAGIVVGSSFEDVGKKMTNAMNQAHNLVGLKQAAKGVRGAMALSSQEIVGVARGLSDAGLAGRNLQTQMAATGASISGTGDHLVDAATLVRTFSGSLGIADAAITGMMGNMAFEFDSTMGSMKDTFTDITNAVHGTSMSTNRFLGIVQTATAGMSLFEDQVSGVADLVGKLGKNAALSGQDIASLAKTVGGFGKDTDQAVKGFALLGKKGMSKMGKDMDPTIAKKKDEIKAAGSRGENTERLEAQLGHMVKMQKALVAGNAVAAGTQLKYVDPEASKALVTGLLDMTGKMGGYMGEKVAKMMGVYEAHIQNVAGGGAMVKQLKTGEKTERKGGSAPKSTKELQDIEAKKQHLTGAAYSKLLDALKNRAATLATDYKKTTAAIAVTVGALGALATAAKLVGGSLIGGAAGGAGATMLMKFMPKLTALGPIIAGLAKSVASLIVPVLAVGAAALAGLAVGTGLDKLQEWIGEKMGMGKDGGAADPVQYLMSSVSKLFGGTGLNADNETGSTKEETKTAENLARQKYREAVERGKALLATQTPTPTVPANMLNNLNNSKNSHINDNDKIDNIRNKDAMGRGDHNNDSSVTEGDVSNGGIVINVYDATDPYRVAKIVRSELLKLNRGH